MTTLKQLRGQAAQLPNHPSVRDARKMREVFQDAPAKQAYRLDCDWPDRFFLIGQGRSVAYTSNKWKGDPGDFEDFKHVAESPNQTYATPTALRLMGNPRPERGDWPSTRPQVELPPTLAELAPCLFLQVRPIEVVRPRLRLAPHAWEIPTHGAIVYGGHALRRGGDWNRSSDKVAFLSVIHKQHGVLFLITGRDLTVTEDGIAG